MSKKFNEEKFEKYIFDLSSNSLPKRINELGMGSILFNVIRNPLHTNEEDCQIVFDISKSIYESLCLKIGLNPNYSQNEILNKEVEWIHHAMHNADTSRSQPTNALSTIYLTLKSTIGLDPEELKRYKRVCAFTIGHEYFHSLREAEGAMDEYLADEFSVQVNGFNRKENINIMKSIFNSQPWWYPQHYLSSLEYPSNRKRIKAIKEERHTKTIENIFSYTKKSGFYGKLKSWVGSLNRVSLSELT
jgi:hypothetical protein